MAEYGLEFLKEKGFFETRNEQENKYEGRDRKVLGSVKYFFDPKNRLAFFDSFQAEHIPFIIKSLTKKRTFDYYWFWKDGRLFAYRTFGENKQFIFNTNYSQRSDYVKSKEDKLLKFSSSNPTALFEVKDVISRFYRNLWELRLKLAKAIKDNLSDKDKILAAQRLLDRLIFTYFLAEKGIIYGIDKRGRRREVRGKKLRELFKYLIKVSEDFHGLLNDIFFEYLNNPKKSDMPIKGAQGYSLFIPYLNGGLFRDQHLISIDGEAIRESKLKIEGFDWSELIKELNEYNWIIEEYSSSEEEDTIGKLTPEILGHIYEKFVITVSELDDIDVSELEIREGELRKGNKKIGAYYTPEVITNYIAENTIFPFVMDKLGLEGKYENFNAFFEARQKDSETLSRFNSVLKDIKILDPAVGSGAFLMAAADLLFNWRQKCGETLDDYALRRDIIINNLYGVDIMEGAVEICMLRLWLWLIAAADPEEEIDALPNIEFNIFEGNSLIGYVDTAEVADISMKKRKKKAWKSLEIQYAKLDSYYEDSILSLFKRRNEKIREYKEASGKRAEKLRKEIQSMTEDFKEILNGKLLSEVQAKGIDIDEDDLKSLKPFHWVMEFSDVFEKGGFDVVIGNPPYLSFQKGLEIEKYYLKKYYTSAYRNFDYYVLFVERGLTLSNKNGRLGIIIPNKFIDSQYGKKIKEFISKNSTILELIDFNDYVVFEGIKNYTCILLLDLNPKLNKDMKYLKIETESPVKNLRQILYSMPRKIISPDDSKKWILIDKSKKVIIDWAMSYSKRLGEISLVYEGVRPGPEKVYVLNSKDTEINSHHIKPFIKSKNVDKYKIKWQNDSYIIFPYNDTISPINIEEYPKIKRYLDNFREVLYDNRGKGGPRYLYYHCPKGILNKNKIITPDIAKSNEFSIDVVGTFVFPNTLYGINLKQEFKGLEKSILGMLNSNLLEFVIKNWSPSIRGGYYRYKTEYLRELPIMVLGRSSPIFIIQNIITDYLLFLNQSDELKEQNNFFDLLSNALVYELYFSSKFKEDGRDVNLAAKVQKHLEPIEYDRWAELAFKDDLTDDEKRKKEAIERKNMEVIERVYRRLKEDREIMEDIEKIKSHPWVKVVEGVDRA